MKNQSIKIATAFLIFLVTGCSSLSENSIGKYKVPSGWEKSSDNSLESVVAPEKDMKIFFHKEIVDKNLDFSKRSVELWKQVNPKFSYKELQTTSPPSKEWDKITQVVYQVPAEESKVVLTLLRVKDGVGHFSLVESSSATLSKRTPQMMQILESWKPDSIKEEDFSKVKPKKFAEVEKEFETFLLKSMSELNIPGMTIGITQGGKTVYQKGFGSTKTKGGSPVNKDTLFMIGSTTKPLTTLLISKLVQDGKVQWNDPISKHLDGWSLKDKSQSDSFLMKHSACACTGMPRRDLDFIFNIEGISPEKRMRQMAEMSPTSKSGETFQYSNYLVAAGGFAAARAYNKELPLFEAYRKAMGELVFKPLDMNHTYIRNSNPYMKNSAFPHSLDLNMNPKPISLKLEEFANSVAPAGSIWSNSTDMLKYLKFELSKGKSSPGYINEKDLLLRRKKGVTITKDASYGLGFILKKFKGIEIVEHGGNTLGFTSEMLFIPENNIGMTILVNMGSANGFTRALRSKFFELMFGLDAKSKESFEFYKAEAAKSRNKVKELIKKDLAKTSKFVGKYRSKELGHLSIKKSKGKFIADFGEFSSELKEKNDPGKKRVFLLTSPPWGGTFSLLEDKNGLVIDVGQQKYLFRKM